MKLKGLNFKTFVLQHGEKIGLGLICLVVLLGFAKADWAPYAGTPSQITSKVNESRDKLVNHDWPEDERKPFELTDDQKPAQVVEKELRLAFNITDYQYSKPKFAVKPLEHSEPLTEPKWDKLEDPIADAGRVLLQVVDPESRMLAASSEASRKPEESKTVKAQADQRPDEFRVRAPGGTSDLAGPGGLRSGADPRGADPSAMMANASRRGPVGDPRRGGDPRKKGGTRNSAPSNSALLTGGGAEEAGIYGGFGGGEQSGRGFHYVSVRAVFPIRDQIRKIAQATQSSVASAQVALEILDFDIERQTMKFSGDPWDGPWQPVDVSVSRDVLTKIAADIEPDVVAPQVTDSAITMPLPTRISGVWYNDATHPRIRDFTLSEEQIQLEADFNEKLLQKMEEENKSLPPAPAEKKGWGDVGTDVRSLRTAALGAGSGVGGMLGGSSAAAMMSRSMTGATGADPRMGRGIAGAGAKNDVLEDLLKLDDAERSKELRKYIESVAKRPDGELLLFRYLDFSVEPGYTYRYRVRLTFRNPNFNRKQVEAGGNAAVVSGETRKSDWCDPTTPATVQKDQNFYVADVKTSIAKPFPVAHLNVFQWDAGLGSLQQAVFDVPLGQTVTSKEKTDVLDPAKNTFENKSYTFRSTDFPVDALPDISIDSSAHPDLSAAGGFSKGDLKLNEQVLVASVEGDLKLLDPVAQKDIEAQQANNLKYQNENYKSLKDDSSGQVGGAGDLAGGLLGGGLLGGGAGSSATEMMMSRGRNPLGRGSRGRTSTPQR